MTQKIEEAANRCQPRQREGGWLPYGQLCNSTCIPRISPLERGFSMISAIFLLIVIAALGTFAVTLSSTQHQTALLDILGSRTYQAARAGIEWGAYQVVPGSALDFASSCRASGNSSNTISPLAGTLANCTVTVNCIATSHPEGASTVWGYQLAASAAQGAGTFNYVERTIASDVWVVE